MTLPLAPRSGPEITLTVSPFLTFMLGAPPGRLADVATSQHLRGQRDDLHEALVPQFPADRAEDAGAARLAVGLDQHRGVLVEADVRPVRPAALLRGADHDRLDDVALLHGGAGQRVLDRAHDDVADAGVAPAGAAEHPDAEDLLRTGVVGHPQPGLLLYHLRSPAFRRARRSNDSGAFTSPFPRSRPAASAWWPTAGGSPSAARGPR